MFDKIKEVAESIQDLSKRKKLKIISHNDTDGITSAAIFSRALQRKDISFSLEIIKNLESEYISNLSEDSILVFLDLASGSLKQLSEKKTEVIILDHHIVEEEIPENITMINPHIFNEENIASSAICYLFAKELSEQNKDLANLAVIGMIGDMMEKNIGKVYSEILNDAEVNVKKGLLMYPATRPIDRVLESSFGIYIPGVTGSYKGAIELLRDAGIQKSTKGFKSLAELSEKEMSSLGTAIMLRKVDEMETENIIGNIYLIKFYNHVEDAREISAMINACSRMGNPEIALGLCFGNKDIKKMAEKTYAKYKKTISAALEQVSSIEKISGKNYTIINAKEKIRDTIIGTVASIMSYSPLYSEGTVIVTMSYTPENDKIKVSARLAGRKGRNVRDVLHRAVTPLNGEVGGHKNAAGCLLPIEKESEFIENLCQTLEVELIKA